MNSKEKLAKKLGITVEELENRIQKNKEAEEDVIEAMADLLKVGVHILTLGQYLQPTRNHHPVVDWITPNQFDKYKAIGLEMGFKYVESGPLVRSSYHAEKHLFDF